MLRRRSAQGWILRLSRSRPAACPDESGEAPSDQSRESQKRLGSDSAGRAWHRGATVETVTAVRRFGRADVAVSGPKLQAFAAGRLRLSATGPVAAARAIWFVVSVQAQGSLAIPQKGFLLLPWLAR